MKKAPDDAVQKTLEFMHQKARKSRWMGLPGDEVYCKTLDRNREIFLEKEGGSWSVWWGLWFSGQKNPAKAKTLGFGLTFDEALERGNDYVAWWFGSKRKKLREE